ncbi:glycosyltransferase [Flavimarina sp. Hel_I_48]|uniref:glycosyltransferase n=1 Tax=Flavimarina sp. Hel_I_48 TaxID=1392488 RepID=UPI0004DFC93B|nr:glycosyltransferase [Flavimarina sp. Hel_I_48]
MKLSYIVEVDPLVHSGIIKKINNQIRIWKGMGHVVQILVLWPKASTTDSIKYIEGDYISNKFLDKLPQGFLNTYATKIIGIKKVESALRVFQPDVVYIRQGIWYPGLTSVLKRYRTIMELNTVDFLEMEFYSGLKKNVYLWGKNRILASISGLVAVTPDILKHYKDLAIPQKVVSNGIDLRKFEVRSNTDSTPSVNLVFVGSENMYWHGLDKILELANLLPEYQFNIVGYDRKNIESPITDNVKFYGWLSAQELSAVYSKSNLGIGSFGNYHVGKNTDSTLKVLEYLAHGLPVLMGHQDVDFHDSDFVFKATDKDHNFLPISIIKSFIENNKNRRINPTEIEQVDSSNKERERLAFFEAVAKDVPPTANNF